MTHKYEFIILNFIHIFQYNLYSTRECELGKIKGSFIVFVRKHKSGISSIKNVKK